MAKLAAGLRRPRTVRAGAAEFGLVLLVGAVLDNLINPGFGLDLSSLASFLAVTAALCVGVPMPAKVDLVYRRRRHGREEAKPSLKAIPAGLLAAAFCVAVSRLTSFEPGYLYGLICRRRLPRQSHPGPGPVPSRLGGQASSP